jgi:AcrR family transcriptional regulator
MAESGQGRDGDADPDGPAPVLRRAPFSDNPQVGARGQRTQQRILDAALEVFGEEGYHRASIERIATRAGSSRASFYQYFADKEDVFRNLTGQVARQLRASTEAMDSITADEAGWSALRTWVEAQAAVYHRYEPVFHLFDSASASDARVASGSARWARGMVAAVRVRVEGHTLPTRQLDGVLLDLHGSLTRSLDVATLLRSLLPEAWPEEPVVTALTDVIHRSLFGRDDAVNVHRGPRRRRPPIPFDPSPVGGWGPPPEVPSTEAGRRTLERLTRAGRTVLVARGYHGTRVDDVVELAEVSHGAFYRYFESKEHLARVLVTAAMRTVSQVLVDAPPDIVGDGATGRRALRAWLRRYAAIQTEQTALLRVWTDAALADPDLRAATAPALDWGRRTMAAWLAPRGFGDVDTDGLVLESLMSLFGGRTTGGDVEATALVIERGLLGQRSG